MPESNDVQTGSSPAEPHEDAATAAVNADETTQQPDRPLQNTVAEYNRKMAKLQQDNAQIMERLNTISQFLATTQQPAPPPQPVQAQDTDEMLWARAQQGDREAFVEHQRRITERELRKHQTVNTRSQLTQGQMQALLNKYPVLNDAGHPLTQTAQAAYQLLLRHGYPQGQETLLEACKTAIADRPDLVSDIYSQSGAAGQAARRSSVSMAQAGQTGATVRNTAPPAKDGVKVKPGEKELAARMGIKDPLKAKQRFLERQEKGQSHLGAVSGFVNAEDF